MLLSLGTKVSSFFFFLSFFLPFFFLPSFFSSVICILSRKNVSKHESTKLSGFVDLNFNNVGGIDNNKLVITSDTYLLFMKIIDLTQSVYTSYITDEFNTSIESYRFYKNLLLYRNWTYIRINHFEVNSVQNKLLNDKMYPINIFLKKKKRKGEDKFSPLFYLFFFFFFIR